MRQEPVALRAFVKVRAVARDLGWELLVRRLLELGADPDLRDQHFDVTPLDWARHFHQPSTADLLGPVVAPPASGE
ncbi:hypothetical protein ADK67_26575 [Saccharothrix sp. NRRL B-16348]|uniref:hypothetical protein n=1 Tax=Saccharothrix sp. NRRL B-16348 TaxID=1415542 RepID=UPI0006ADEFD2|nr:hypothetical protein [Saccharothrix sp. NRRL B-16348]KOX21552.1 hypothetical protein ADK67_26575 [Saccharothrix sp. NRRL B-16348]